MTQGDRLVLCLGNADRGDDGVGRLVARLLRGRLPPDVLVEEQDGNGMAILERLRGLDSVFLVDAAVTGAPVGTVHTFDCAEAGDRTASADSAAGTVAADDLAAGVGPVAADDPATGDGTVAADDLDAGVGTVAAALPARSGASSHGLGVAEAIALARVLDCLPRVCRLYAIEGASFAPGTAISTPVAAAAELVAAELASAFATR